MHGILGREWYRPTSDRGPVQEEDRVRPEFVSLLIVLLLFDELSELDARRVLTANAP